MKDNKLTITLTGRTPVRVNKDEWPILASAFEDEYDNEHKFQANRVSEWTLKVRRNADGRAIVYGIYNYETRWQGEKNRNVRGGELVAADADIPAVIRRVAADMEEMSDSDGMFLRLARECIADLPAEEL